MYDTNDLTSSSSILRYIILGLLGVVGFFLRGVLSNLGKLQTEVQELKTKIAIVLDRDRRKRLGDYENENGS